ncbi:hypothetical protein [Streptomyces sp. NPDC055058]
MTDTVTLRHPNLPPDQTITVAKSAVPHHRAAGWVPVAPEPAPAPDQPDAPAGLPAPENTEAAPADVPAAPEPQPAARKRRRATEGE